MNKIEPEKTKNQIFGRNVISTNNVDRVIVWTTNERYCSLGSEKAWGYRTGRIYPKKLKSETVINKGQNGNPTPAG